MAFSTTTLIACGIFIDRLWCRHNDTADFKQVTVFTDWTAVTVGAGHWCALRRAGSASNDGALYCWGRNAKGQLGLGHTVDENGPLPAHVGTMRWTSISAGWNNTCGISSQTLYCWGSGENGVLGLGNNASQTRPARIGGRWLSVSAGMDHTCAIDTNKRAYCWGSNEHGQLGVLDGNGNPPDHSWTPTLVASSLRFDSISVGSQHTCGISMEALYCWGWNHSGQVGVGDVGDQFTPQLVVPGGRWKSVSAGGFVTCAIDLNDFRYCWGTTIDGRLGNYSTDPNSPNEYFPVGFFNEGPWTSVVVGYHNGCAIKADRGPQCWGPSFGNQPVPQ